MAPQLRTGNTSLEDLDFMISTHRADAVPGIQCLFWLLRHWTHMVDRYICKKKNHKYRYLYMYSFSCIYIYELIHTYMPIYSKNLRNI